MNLPYVSLTLARRYVTEIVRSPRTVASLGAPVPRPAAPAVGTSGLPAGPVTTQPAPVAHA